MKLNNNLAKYFYKRRYFIIAICIAALAILLFFDLFKVVLFLSLLLVLNIGASAISRFIPRYKTSIELIMFGTVLCGYVYGSKIGALFGLIASILYYFGVGRMSYFVIVFAPLYAIIGIIAGIFNTYNIFQLGMALTLSYTVISSILVFIIFGAKFDKALGFAIINTFFNFIMFKYFAGILLAIMQL
ncbi:hypothetical protein H6503_00220 [Candidatus Woesearchaeota archaeon]|nr:hypothetical protein [Candidatus Woesearchaeota archaeon]